MRVIHVTGISGSGKSTMARRLRALGHPAISADSATGLCRWVDRGDQPTPRPAHPDAAWLAAHRWVWDPDRLDALIAEAGDAGGRTLIVCGYAANDLDLDDRFDWRILLDIDRATMVARLAEPARGNDFGRAGDSAHALIAGFQAIRARYASRSDVIIDATADLDTVTAAVVRATGLDPPA